MSLKTSLVLGLAVMTLPFGLVSADESAVGSARAAFEKYSEFNKAYYKKLTGLFNTAREEQAKAREEIEDKEKLSARIKEIQEELTNGRREIVAEKAKLSKEFTEAFLTSGPDAFTGEKDQELLELGLVSAAGSVADEKPKQAIGYYELLLEKFPKSNVAASTIRYRLPGLYPAAYSLEEATKKVETLQENSKDELTRYMLEVSIGDLLAAQGKVKEARQRYTTVFAAAVKAGDASAKSVEGFEAPAEAKEDDDKAEEEKEAGEKGKEAKTEPLRRGRRASGKLSGIARYAALRLNLVGKPAPNTDSKTWLGGNATPLTELKGKVVLVDFWATWCGPCIGSIPSLVEMKSKHPGDEFVILGVTKEYENGYVAANLEELAKGERNGKVKRGMDTEAFMTHLKDFRANTGVNYPFVVAEQDDFKKYFIRGIPTMVLIDRDGKIRLAVVGSGSKALLKKAVALELKTSTISTSE